MAEVEKTGKDTYLNQVVELVRTAQESKSKTQDLANRAAMYLTIIALTVGTLTFIFWIFYGKQLVFALERAVTVMVITCPHALGLAIPLVVAVSTSIAAKSGLLIRIGRHLGGLAIFRLSFLTKQVHSQKEGLESRM